MWCSIDNHINNAKIGHEHQETGTNQVHSEWRIRPTLLWWPIMERQERAFIPTRTHTHTQRLTTNGWNFQSNHHSACRSCSWLGVTKRDMTMLSALTWMRRLMRKTISTSLLPALEHIETDFSFISITVNICRRWLTERVFQRLLHCGLPAARVQDYKCGGRTPQRVGCDYSKNITADGIRWSTELIEVWLIQVNWEVN